MSAPAPLDVLAAYMTDGQRVVRASIGLELSGRAYSEAAEFFALRQAFGVDGYMQPAEARAAIAATLALP